MFNYLCIFDTFVIISLCQKAHECCICLTQHTRNTFPQENRSPGKKFIHELALTSFSITVTGLVDIRVWTHCNAVLSSPPDNPGDSRFWIVSPGLQIRVWYLPDNCQSCSFCRLDFPTIKLQIFCIVCYCNLSNNVSKYELFMCYKRWSESTSIFGTNDIICRAIWCHLSLLPYQFSIFDDVGGWQPCNGSLLFAAV